MTLHGPPVIRLKFEGVRQASLPSLCASVRAVPWADEAEQQLSRLDLSGCDLYGDVRFSEQACRMPLHGPPVIRLKFEVARQASSRSLCASVRAVPWADEAEQQLSRLARSGCELSADVRIFRAGLRRRPSRTPNATFEVGGGKTSKQPQSLCLCASSAMGR